MYLPNADRAVVDIVKLRDYCLSATHPRGRHKARVFATALGLTDADATVLQAALLQAVLVTEAVPALADQYGQRYVVDFSMHGPAGQAMVRSSWMVRTGETVPRLVTCFVR